MLGDRGAGSPGTKGFAWKIFLTFSAWWRSSTCSISLHKRSCTNSMHIYPSIYPSLCHAEQLSTAVLAEQLSSLIPRPPRFKRGIRARLWSLPANDITLQIFTGAPATVVPTTL